MYPVSVDKLQLQRIALWIEAVWQSAKEWRLALACSHAERERAYQCTTEQHCVIRVLLNRRVLKFINE